MSPIDDWMTIKAFCEKYPHMITIGGLRHLIFFADENGIDRCIRRMGKKLVISPSRFFVWLEEKNTKTWKM